MEYIQVLGGKFSGGGGSFNPTQEMGLIFLVAAVIVVLVGMFIMGRGKG